MNQLKLGAIISSVGVTVVITQRDESAQIERHYIQSQISFPPL
jgi:hypothetical protein